MRTQEELRAYNREYYHSKRKDTLSDYRKKRRSELRQRILDYYGAVCKCCGEHRVLFLTIDHVNNDGSSHRKKLGGTNRSGNDMKVLKDIVDRDFPDDYQILCYNCNCGKQRNNGICPHEEEGS